MLSIVQNKQKKNRYLFYITQKSSNTNNGKTKKGVYTIYIICVGAKALVNQILIVYQLTKTL